MNGKHVDWSPSNAMQNPEWVPGGMMSAARADMQRREKRQKFILNVIHFMVVLALIGAFMLLAGRADARQRFAVRSNCAGGQCAINQQAVVQHVQKVVAAPVVHHAAPVVHQAYVPPVQNFFYSVGQPLVQQSQMAAAVKDAMAELQFNAQVNGTIRGNVTGGTQGYYQQPTYQQPAPQWQPPSQPVAPPPQQPPAEPTPPAEPPQFSMTAPSATQQACGACHANGKSKGGFSLEHMTGDQLWSAIERIKDGSMPPKGGLDQAAKEAVAKELLARQQ